MYGKQLFSSLWTRHSGPSNVIHGWQRPDSHLFKYGMSCYGRSESERNGIELLNRYSVSIRYRLTYLAVRRIIHWKMANCNGNLLMMVKIFYIARVFDVAREIFQVWRVNRRLLVFESSLHSSSPTILLSWWFYNGLDSVVKGLRHKWQSTTSLTVSGVVRVIRRHWWPITVVFSSSAIMIVFCQDPCITQDGGVRLWLAASVRQQLQLYVQLHKPLASVT